MTLLQTETPTPDTVKLLFEAKGPDHMGIMFSPEVGVLLQTWSFADGQPLEGPKWKDDRSTYYIFHSRGMMATPFQFWLEFKVGFVSLKKPVFLKTQLFLQTPRGFMGEHHDVMDMVVAGHVTHGNGMKSPAFKEFLSQFPAWSYPVGWTSSYKMYKF